MSTTDGIANARKNAARINRMRRSSSLSLARAAHRHEVARLLRVDLDLAAQLRDVDVYGARLDIRGAVVAPDAREQLGARHGPLRVGLQIAQDLDLAPREGERLAAAAARQVTRVDLDVAVELDLRGALDAHARAAQNGFHAQHELRDGEGLGDVVVGAEREPVHDVLVARLRREHDDRLIAI